MIETEGDTAAGPYAIAALNYLQGAWQGVLPVTGKWPPPKGYTGADGLWPSSADVLAWADGAEGRHNIGLRLPPHLIGVDVDAYGGKPGLATFADALTRWGPLPTTWTATSRTDGSGIRLFTVPPGLKWPGVLGPGVEIIQYRHRYAMCWPSVHPDTGQTYRWLAEGGVMPDGVIPYADELPLLPPSWVIGLTHDEAERDIAKLDLSDDAVVAWLAAAGAGNPCAAVVRALRRAQAELASGASRHDTAMRSTARLALLAAEGHRGVSMALAELGVAFAAAVKGDASRSSEWERMVGGAVRIAAVRGVQPLDPCAMWGGGPVVARPDTATLLPSALTESPPPPPTAPPLARVGPVEPPGAATAPRLSVVPDLAVGEPVSPPVPAGGPDPATDPMLALEVAQQRVRRQAKVFLDNEEAAALRADGKGHLTDGATFILDTPARVPMIWGSGGEIAWAEGESLMLVGPPGVGKTTLAGQIIRARLGLGANEPVLGMSVMPSDGRVLYLAMDRPAQAARALRRLFSPGDRAALAARLVVWRGPPPEDVARNPQTFMEMAQAATAETIVVDSVKDAAVGLSEDDIAAGYNRARQNALADGVQMLELHHLVKRGANGTKPTTLADVYGSTWLTAGAGSVILLWGAAGDAIVELHHLKQPAEPIGPYKIVHDHDLGVSEIWHSTDLVALAGSAPAGLSAKAAAEAINDTTKPTDAQVEGARRKLAALVKTGQLVTVPGTSSSGQNVTVWKVTEKVTALPFGATSHGTAEGSRNPVKQGHEQGHGGHAEARVTHSPPFRGGMQNAGGSKSELAMRLIAECRAGGGKPVWISGELIDSVTGIVLIPRSGS